MERKNVLITVTVNELPQFTQCFYSEKAQRALSGLFDAIIRIVGVVPEMNRDEQIALFSKTTGVPVGTPGEYRMHIGTDVQNTKEISGGIELPVRVLQTVATFQEEVVARLRVAIGAPGDN